MRGGTSKGLFFHAGDLPSRSDIRDAVLLAAYGSPDPNRRQMISLYASYEEVCQRGGLVDFAELLLRAHELLREQADVCAHYRGRFAKILVDEFQDTNAIQYAWIRMLAGDTGRVFVVGDDDDCEPLSGKRQRPSKAKQLLGLILPYPPNNQNYSIATHRH